MTTSLLTVRPSPFRGFIAELAHGGYLGEGRTERAAVEDLLRHERWWARLTPASVPRPGEDERLADGIAACERWLAAPCMTLTGGALA